MNDAARIAVGAGAAMLLAWVAHGPLGNGAAFVRDLRERAGIALATRGVTDVSVDFETQPLSRVATLSGSLASATRSKAAGIVSDLAGVSSIRWTGDRAAENAPARPAAPGSLTTAACQKGVESAVKDRAISFRSGSAWLNPQSRRIIGEVAAVLKRCPAMAIEVGNHAGGTGRNALNRAMAHERARRVRDVLIEQGVPPSAVIAKGDGASARRIGFTVVKKGS